VKSYFTFKNFIKRNPRYQKFADNDVAKKIYENIFCKGETIYKMQIFSNLELPALTASIIEIENKFSDQDEFNLKNNYNKSCLGVMVKDVLKPFGYVKIKNKKIPQGFSKFVSKASVYDLEKSKINCKLVKKFTIISTNDNEEFSL